VQLEAFPSSVLRVVLEPGDELVDALKRALNSHPGAFVVSGAGEVEDAEVLVLQASGRGRTHHKLQGAADLVTMSAVPGEQGLEIRAVLAAEAGSEIRLFAGLLVRATVVSADARVVIRDAPSPSPSPSPPVATPARATPAPAALPAPAAPVPVAVPTVPVPQAARADASPVPPRASSPAPVTAASGPPLPPKMRRAEQPDSYPEEGDVVTHFAFGRCVVVFSDGERIRFQQERDGRVREVALSMLRIQDPTIGEDGKRHWELQRKN
jgi:predicted DNA-binding protein with PD1-like motif